MSSASEPGTRSVAELVASLRSAFSAVAFEEVQKFLDAIQGSFDRELEHLRSENQSLRNEFERVYLENIRLEEERLKRGESSDECVAAAERPGIAEDVYEVLMEKVGRGGGETSLKRVFHELRRKNDELENEKRESESQVHVWAKKYKELDQRLSQLERETSTLLGSREGESQVLPEPDGLIDANGCGDRGSTQRGNDSNGGGSVSFTHDARKKLHFGTGACLSPLLGPSRKSSVKEDGVLQGDGSSPIVEIIDSDDDSCGGPSEKLSRDKYCGRRNDEKGNKELKRKRGDGSSPIVDIIDSDDDGCGGPSEKLSGDKYCGRRNDEKGNKELKRKRDSVSSVSDEPLTQSLRSIMAAPKQCAQKNIKETDSDSGLSKSTGVNPIRHEYGVGSTSTKPEDGSSSRKEHWKYEANIHSLCNSLTCIRRCDGVNPLKEVEACNIDDDVAGSRHLSGMHLGGSNQENKNRGLKRKRDSIAQEKKLCSGTAKPGDGSCLHGGAWKNAEELHSDLKRDYKLCMKAVCALYRRNKLASNAIGRSSIGFSGLRLLRGNYLAGLLMDGDPQCRLKKSVEDLQDRVLEDCRNIATEHCHQLFEMYQQKEDPFL